MNRKELYDFIKSHSLADSVKSAFGKNFTNVSTDELQAFVNQHQCKSTKSSNCTENRTENCTRNNKLEKLVEILFKKRILLKSEVNTING